MEPITTKSVGIDGEVFDDRRKQLRRRVLKGGTLRFNNGFSAFECVVRNQSARGARLAFGEASAVPAYFDLRIAGEERPRRVRVRWRSATDVGVEADQPDGDGDVPAA